MFRELRLAFLVIEFVINACQAYAQTDVGAAELQDIEDTLAMTEQDGTSGFESAVGMATSTLDQARAALKGKK